MPSPFTTVLIAVVYPEDNSSPYANLDGPTFDDVEVVDCVDDNGENDDNDENDAYKKRGSGFTKREDVLVCKTFFPASQDSQVAAF
jgi:hypothetical protein